MKKLTIKAFHNPKIQVVQPVVPKEKHVEEDVPKEPVKEAKYALPFAQSHSNCQSKNRRKKR